MVIPDINISDYFYELPEEKIPYKPLEKRDESKLLFYKNGQIADHIFKEIPALLPSDSHLVFNNTKVFPARLIFEKETGALIEVFCLQPISQVLKTDFGHSMKWEVMVGNLKRWKKGVTLKFSEYELFVTLLETKGEECEVLFEWIGDADFFGLLEQTAELPLPPYMNRKADENDKTRYQTVYAQHKGSVAAPTAGLHFTTQVLDEIKQNHFTSELTLHVGIGTFKPVKAQKINEHKMHSEYFVISKELIESLLKNENIIPVGTTSMRVLESIYWIGFMLINKAISLQNIYIPQWIGYQKSKINTHIALERLLEEMNHLQLQNLSGTTSIIIVPGYEFRLCRGIITNFHQPGSTLILLVASLLGENWKKVYDYALENNYRFLSYGDSSLLLR
jgi:S-adenosylmethionine:tRNA ribosyltransferase-isomerase